MNKRQTKDLLFEEVARMCQAVPSHKRLERQELVAQGTSNRNIAGKLWISEATVKSHLLHIYGKLGASDRASAVSVAMKRGILRH